MTIKWYWRIVVSFIVIALGVITNHFVDSYLTSKITNLAIGQMTGGDATYAAYHSVEGTVQIVSIIISLVVIGALIALWATVIKNVAEKIN
jgi:hypothetical protein